MSEKKLKYTTYVDNKQLNIKDLITLALYNVLIILLMAVGLGICAAIFSVLFAGKVYFSVFTSVATALFAAPAYTLIFNKINKNYAIFISAFVLGLFLFLSGHAAVAFPISVIGGIVAEYFFRKRNEYLSYICYSLGNIGSIIPMYFMRNNYINHLTAKGFSQEKIDLILKHSDLMTFVIIVVLTILAAVIGTSIGRKIYFRNFDKAGI